MANQSIQSLNPRHYKILDYVLRGMSNVQIANVLDMSQNAISLIVNSPSFEQELAIRRSKLEEMSNHSIVDMNEEVVESIRKGTKDAVKRILSAIQSPDEAIALRASTEILDRGGYPKVNRIESKNISVTISAKDAAVIANTIQLDKEKYNEEDD